MSSKAGTLKHVSPLEEIDSPLRDAITLLETNFTTQVTVRELLTGGKSGAFVALVDCIGQVDGVYILKASVTNATSPNEEQLHRLAIETGAFSQKIPKIIAFSHTAKAYCLLLQIAGGSRLTWRPLVASQKLLRSAYLKLGDALWTRHLQTFGDQTKAFTLLQGILGYRLTREAGGRISDRIRSISPLLETSSSFVHLEHRLPNPYYFANNPELFTSITIRPLLAPLHGDLHAGNLFILPDQRAEARDVCLIDFASFEKVAPFFYDHAYFELSTLLRTFPGLAPQRWMDLCHAMLPGGRQLIENLDPSERAWAMDLFVARQKALSMAQDAYPDRADDLHLQHLISQVAAGLAFLNKQPQLGSGSLGLTPDQYQQALIWAAAALSTVLEACRTQLPAESNPVPTVGPRRLVAEQIEEPDWQSVSGYDHPGLNVLILGPDVRTSQPAALETLFRVPWNLVLDFCSDPLPDPSILLSPRPIRSAWPGGELPGLGLLERGASWLFVNGREDLSPCPPMTGFTAWRRRYRRWMEDFLLDTSSKLGPPSVRTLFYSQSFDQDFLRSAMETLDNAFAEALAPLLIACNGPITPIDGAKVVSTTPAAAISRFAISTSASLPLQSLTRIAQIPRRLPDGRILLAEVPEELALRVGRDLTIVHRGLSNILPQGRVFGVDFHRGMAIEWAELAADLDVPRDAFLPHRKALGALLNASNNATHNLFHHPSAGGSTLSRRLAWSLMEEYPTVIVDQLTVDTISYLRDLFRYSSLPLLILLENSVVTESAREAMLHELREDNTRAVFLAISRTYQDSSNDKVLSSILSDREASRFLEIYQNQTTDLERRADIAKLVHSPDYLEQRSPFFFGLLAFGDGYLGLERLLADSVDLLSDTEKDLLADLCLITVYSSDAFPSADFDELCRRLNSWRRPFEPESPLVYEQADHIRVSHSFLAKCVLIRLARSSDAWKADLGRFSEMFLEHINHISHSNSLRVRGIIESLFITRDTPMALQVDSDALAGAIPQRNRFAPIIEAIGNPPQARHILQTLYNRWPNEPHFAVHYVRHLLYESPPEIEKAIQVMEFACRLPDAVGDDVLVHMLGMCFRARMQARLDEAISENLSFPQTAPAIRKDFELALQHFGRAIEINPLNEHGRVATIQTVQRLLLKVMEIVHVKSLQELIKTDETVRWCLDTLGLAEEQVLLLRERPSLSVSLRTKKAIAQWDTVYGSFDAVISNLKVLTKRYEDVGIRRALYGAIVAKHGRHWEHMPQGDLCAVEELSRRNVETQGIRDGDVRSWLMAYRHLPTFDIEAAIRRLSDWHEIRPSSIEPSFFSYLFRFLQWLNSEPKNEGYADEALRWLRICRGQRQVGQRNWGYEWLTLQSTSYRSIHFSEIGFDPVYAIRTGDLKSQKQLSSALGRVNATLSDYSGPQRGTLDLGHGLHMHVTPLDKLVKDHLGRQVSVLVSFGYDGPVAWDPRLV